MDGFNVPVVLYLFKRVDKAVEVVRQVAKVAPKKIYLLSDGGRTEQEWAQVERCRAAVEAEITWDCEIIRRYSDTNIGVYANIGQGAKWVFEREPIAIFLEDDNFPELTFFKFCEEILQRYQNDTRVLWICGTNYLKECSAADGASYIFTKNMMPCGWASWAHKFVDFYDGELELWASNYVKRRIIYDYAYKPLYYQDKYNIEYEIAAKKATGRFYSWDYQMSFSMRVHNLYAIVPTVNQITNIGADEDSTHGGVSSTDVMVHRFCGLPTKSIEFPLKHPAGLLIDEEFEKQVAKIILDPRFFSVKSIVSRWIRRVLDISPLSSISLHLKTKLGIK